MAMMRSEAVAIIAQHELQAHDRVWRGDELYCICASSMEDLAGWHDLPASLRHELEKSRDDEIADPEHARFDPILLLLIKASYAGATNEYLAERLVQNGNASTEVTGDAEQLESCPCCGRKALGERGTYEICGVCWWEDDGQDNPTASQALGGPNGSVSLVEGRVNFLKYGIFDPKRIDLRQFQVPPGKYAIGRVVVLDEDGTAISERGCDWRALI
jgi:hypothetical protein